MNDERHSLQSLGLRLKKVRRGSKVSRKEFCEHRGISIWKLKDLELKGAATKETLIMLVEYMDDDRGQLFSELNHKNMQDSSKLELSEHLHGVLDRIQEEDYELEMDVDFDALEEED